MAKARGGAGGGGPDILLIGAVAAMGYLALRSRGAMAATVPTGTTTLRPDYTAQRNIAYTQAGLGLVGAISGLFGAGSPDSILSGGKVSGIFGGGTSNAIEYNNLNGYIGQLGIDATNGWTPAEFGSMNGAYTFGSPVEAPSLGNWLSSAFASS